jgi:hypothetical protein
MASYCKDPYYNPQIKEIQADDLSVKENQS